MNRTVMQLTENVENRSVYIYIEINPRLDEITCIP